MNSVPDVRLADLSIDECAALQLRDAALGLEFVGVPPLSTTFDQEVAKAPYVPGVHALLVLEVHHNGAMREWKRQFIDGQPCSSSEDSIPSAERYLVRIAGSLSQMWPVILGSGSINAVDGGLEVIGSPYAMASAFGCLPDALMSSRLTAWSWLLGAVDRP